jgi:hypothetical protein
MVWFVSLGDHLVIELRRCGFFGGGIRLATLALRHVCDPLVVGV